MNTIQNLHKSGRLTSDFIDLIPHRPPMVWVDEVLSFGAEGGECLVRLKKTNLYFSNGRLRPSSLLEFIAQSQMFIGICLEQIRSPKHQTFKNLFLLSITHAEFKNPDDFLEIEKDMYLIVKIGPSRSLGPFQLFSGSVWTSKLNFLGGASVKAFTQ